MSSISSNYRQSGTQDAGLSSSTVGFYGVPTLYDTVSAKKVSKFGGMYPQGTDEDIKSVRENELVFESPRRHKTAAKVGMPTGFTHLNNEGYEARAEFPDDENARVDRLNDSIRVFGVAMGAVADPSKHPAAPTFTTQIEGVKNIFAGEQLHFGQLVCWTAPSPSDVINDRMVVPGGSSRSKVTLITKSYVERTVSSKFRRAIMNMLRTPERFNALQERRYGRIALNAAITTKTHSSLMDGLLFLYQLMKKGLVRTTLPTDANALDTLPRFQFWTAESSAEEVVLGFARGMGLLNGTNASIPNVNISATQAKLYNSFSNEILKTQYWDGEERNFAFAYDTQTGTIRGQNSRNDIDLTNPFGVMLQLQLQSQSRALSAMNEWISSDRRRILGKVVKSARAGEMAAVL